MINGPNFIAVLGAGQMGRGIAYCAALGGYQVKLYDINESVLASSLHHLQSTIESGLRKGVISEEKARLIKENIISTTNLQEAASEFVIEASPEDIRIKQQLFSEMEQYCPENTIFATNTSAISITEIASMMKNPENVIGMHFFNPVHRMKLVEIIKGLQTSEKTMAITKAVALSIGKEIVEVNEFPGFVTTRINAMIGNEAFYMLMEGVARPEEIDLALKLGLNHPMGPFELGDLVGWDTRLKILDYLHQTLGEKYRPCPLLRQYVAAGRYGKKVGIGVYDYREEKECLVP